MKKKIFLAVLCLMTVGFAALNTTLSINGKISVENKPTDFKVYFSNALVNGTQDLSVVESEQKLYFTTAMSQIGEVYNLQYEVTNASSTYDAALEINCTSGNEYLTITNHMDTYNPLEAKKSRTGNLVIEMKKSHSNLIKTSVEITCSLTANAVGRESIATGNAAAPITRPTTPWIHTDSDGSGDVSVGDVYTLTGDIYEKFNVIQVTSTSIKLLAQKTLGYDYKQNDIQVNPTFSDSDGWAYTPGPKEIDIQTWSGEPKVYLNTYVDYLKEKTGDSTLKGDFISLNQLKNLGCIINDDYSGGNYEDDSLICSKSKYAGWLINGKYWWTKSASSEHSVGVWLVDAEGYLKVGNIAHNFGVRPVIIITLIDDPALAFCEDLGYKYGMEYIMTYEGGDMDEYLGGTPYVCSNDEEYTNACLYMPNGTLMYCQ